MHNRYKRSLVYLPIAFVDSFTLVRQDWQEVNQTKDGDATLFLEFIPTSFGLTRLLRLFSTGMQTLRSFASEQDLDDLKLLFTRTNVSTLALTFIIALLHLLFSFLAFKNDVRFWKGRKSLAGLSRVTVIMNCICTYIIFVYLFDSPQTSLLVLGPAFVSVLIDSWKVLKVCRAEFHFLFGIIPAIRFPPANKSESENETEAFDMSAFSYLTVALAPLVLGASVYSLLYNQHRTFLGARLCTRRSILLLMMCFHLLLPCRRRIGLHVFAMI
eukprot:m.188948 g.188948  ORF g.188948 m.188948 type:complete len:271 (-) comp25650_c0_seq11:211-1023(-)